MRFPEASLVYDAMGSIPRAEVGFEALPASGSARILLGAYFEHHSALVRFLAKRLRCVATARDLAQEVYFRIHRISGHEVVDNPRAFVFQVAANLASDHRRVEGRRAELLEEVHDLLWGPDEEIPPERSVLASDELAHLSRVLDEAPEPSRQVFVLNRFEGLAQREIALRLGISLSTVEKHIRVVLGLLHDARRKSG